MCTLKHLFMELWPPLLCTGEDGGHLDEEDQDDPFGLNVFFTDLVRPRQMAPSSGGCAQRPQGETLLIRAKFVKVAKSACAVFYLRHVVQVELLESLLTGCVFCPSTTGPFALRR